MLGIKNNRVTKRLLGCITNVLNLCIRRRQVLPLSPPDHFSTKQSLHDQVGWEKVCMPHVHKHDHDINLFAINEAADIQRR